MDQGAQDPDGRVLAHRILSGPGRKDSLLGLGRRDRRRAALRGTRRVRNDGEGGRAPAEAARRLASRRSNAIWCSVPYRSRHRMDRTEDQGSRGILGKDTLGTAAASRLQGRRTAARSEDGEEKPVNK